MGIAKNIVHIFEPNPLACGQAVLSMLTGVSVENVIGEVGTERETTLAQMREFLQSKGIQMDKCRRSVCDKEELSQIAVLSLETPKCWHWSLYANGIFYDPEYGILEDFPPSNRRYYWELKDI